MIHSRPASSSLAALCMPLRLRRHDKPVHESAASGEGEDTMHTNPQTSSPETESDYRQTRRGPRGNQARTTSIRGQVFFPVDKSWWQCVVSSKTALFFLPVYTVGWVNNEIVDYLSSLGLRIRSEGKSNSLFSVPNELEAHEMVPK